MKTIQTHSISTGTESHEFGIFDTKGREVGARLSFFTEVFEETAEVARGYCNVEPGAYLVVSVWSTRAGEGFGAAFNRSPLFKIAKDGDETAAMTQRDAYCAKYLKSAKSRAVKNFPVASA